MSNWKRRRSLDQAWICQRWQSEEGVEWLAEVQNADGKWILESTPSGRMQTNLEQKGKPSKWVTLNGLRVIKRLYKDRE